MKKIFMLFFGVCLTIMSGCSNFRLNDEQKDEYFLRKKYCLTRLYFSESDVESLNYVNPESIGIDSTNTFMDFYYGGLDFYYEYGPLFIIQFKCKSQSNQENTVVNESNEIQPAVGKYKIKKQHENDYVLFFDFEDAKKHLSAFSFDPDSNMYKGVAFPDYYVRCTFNLVFVENDQTISKDVILEFGRPVSVHDIDDKPF